MSYNIDSGFFSKLIDTGDFLIVKENQITENYFMGEARNAFKFVSRLVLETGKVPSLRVFKRKFPTFKLEEDNGKIITTEDMLYWCKEVRNRSRHNTLVRSIQESAEMLEDFNTEDAYKRIKSTIAYIESNFTETSAVDITKNSEERVKAYMDKKINRGMIGIPTGFPKLDYIMKGFGESTLTTLIAKTGVGKSWFEIIIGAYCMIKGYRVLQLVTEMPEDVMRDRYEAILFKHCYSLDFNYNQLKSGNLPVDIERKYIDFLKEDLPELQPLIIDTATGVMGVSALMEKFSPEIVLIDSAYLMEDDQNAKDDWLRITHITRDLKKLAKRTKIPIFINTQADKNTSKKTGPELGSIMYSQSVGQDSDNVLALYRDEVMMADGEMCVKVLKQREGELGKVVLNWDFNTMNFSELYSEQDTSSDVEDNTIKLEDEE